MVLKYPIIRKYDERISLSTNNPQNKYVLHAQRSVSMSEDNSQPFRSYNRTGRNRGMLENAEDRLTQWKN